MGAEDFGTVGVDAIQSAQKSKAQNKIKWDSILSNFIQ